jgi:uncharacterized membrane protein/uncharacterized protein YneF (UPF0154 family)
MRCATRALRRIWHAARYWTKVLAPDRTSLGLHAAERALTVPAGRPNPGTTILQPHAHSSFFDRLSILVLSIEWTVFGSMHFSLRAETIEMIPHFVPEQYKLMVATVTGMIEVAIGILLLVPQARQRAALASLVLLAVYVLAVYQILASDPAQSIFQTALRIGLVPNNIFLAICSVYLLQNPGASLTTISAPGGKAAGPPAWTSSGAAILLVAGLLLMSNCAGFLAILAGIKGQQATAYLWAMMCIAIGALIGFLFAVPRVNPAARINSALVTNTNIEQVSDWLTKILVGVGLINFKEIGDFLDRQSGELATSLSADAAAVGKPFALSLIVYFFVVGLIEGYLLTRLFLSRQLALQAPDLEPKPAETTATH